MLKQKYFLTDFFILSAEKQPIKSLWRKIEWLRLFLCLKFEEVLDGAFCRIFEIVLRLQQISKVFNNGSHLRLSYAG